MPSTKDNQFQGVPILALLHSIKSYANEIKEKNEHIVSVAYGGQAHAGYEDGDATGQRDSISAGIFGALLHIGNDCDVLYRMQDTIAELIARAEATA